MKKVLCCCVAHYCLKTVPDVVCSCGVTEVITAVLYVTVISSRYACMWHYRYCIVCVEMHVPK
jgi:hypothetical protein